MNKKNENYIIPLALALDQRIEKEIHFVKLPDILKEKLTHLEELSKNGEGGRGKFIREKHNLPLNSLKKLFVSYLPGVTDMKKVGFNTDDSRWLVSVGEIQIELVIKIIRIWIDAFYIAETELDKKRNNDENAKKYAEKLICEVKPELFDGCVYTENVVLFDNGEVADKDAFSLLPFIAINEIVGTETVVAGKAARWMYSDKNEIVTDPLVYKASDEEDAVSFVAAFHVQTLPPYCKAYLNIDISVRRWISKNKSEKVPFHKEEKSVYVRMDDNKLQGIHAKYDFYTKEFEWVYTDRKAFCGMYGKDNVAKFNDIILNPAQYRNGKEQEDYYIVFEYGMKDGNRQMHSHDAGISPMDRRQIFEDIENKLLKYSNGSRKAMFEAGNDTIVKSYFTDDFKLKKEDGSDRKFRECVDAVCGEGKLLVEVCYRSGQEELKNALMEKLNEHFEATKVEVTSVNIGDLSEGLECSEVKKRDNLEGFHARVHEVKEVLGAVRDFTVSIVIIHEPKYYELNGKTDSRVDPKNALRVGFADTGRLTQFVTIEGYEQKEKERLNKIASGRAIKSEQRISKTYAVNASIKNTLLDVYRQLGIHNYLVASEQKTTLQHKTAVGIYVVNYKNLLDDIALAPFPLVVACDLVNHKITVETELNVISKTGNKKESVEYISCEYKQFPIQFREMLAKIGTAKRIIPAERFLLDWFEDLSGDRRYEIMIAADGTSRKVIEGITNNEIKGALDSQSGYVSKVDIDGKFGFGIELADYDNIDLLRIRVNDEVPDYIPCPNDEEQTFEESRGIYRFDSVYYSKDARTQAEYKNTKQNVTKLNDNRAFTHRNIIEIYPMYISGKSAELKCVRDIHNLRNASIQYEAGKTVLPMPLHLAKKLEEYFI